MCTADPALDRSNALKEELDPPNLNQKKHTVYTASTVAKHASILNYQNKCIPTCPWVNCKYVCYGCMWVHFTTSCRFGRAFIDGILCSSAQEGKLKPGRWQLELFEHVGKGDADHLALLHTTAQRERGERKCLPFFFKKKSHLNQSSCTPYKWHLHKSYMSTHLISSHIHMPKQNQVWYLCTNIQVDHKIFPWGGPEKKVEVATRQPQRLVAVFGYQDVAVGRNRSPDLEHWTPQCLVLGVSFKMDMK